jgi:fructokinase
MMMPVITVVGEALVDLVIDPDGAVTAALGGAPFNTARTCGRLGAEAEFVGVLSTDRFGSQLAAQLVADGVSIDRAPRCELPTTLAAAELDVGGAARYRFYLDGTSAPALDVAPGFFGDVLFTGGLGLVLEPMAETVEAIVASASCPVMIDVNCRPNVITERAGYVARIERVLALATVVKVSDEDLAYLLPDVAPADAARTLLDRGPSAVLLTAGSAGVHVFTAGGEVTIPVDPVDVVDTIGAGDSFSGGLLVWWVERGSKMSVADLDSLAAGVRAACEVAAIVCSRRGADPPWRNELPADWPR